MGKEKDKDKDKRKEKEKDKDAANVVFQLNGQFEMSKVIGFLEDLVTSLKDGAVTFEEDGQQIALKPPGIADFRLAVEQAAGDEGFNLQVRWTQPRWDSPSDALLTPKKSSKKSA